MIMATAPSFGSSKNYRNTGYDEDYIPLYEGRPKRNVVIDSNDILNLKIALNTTNNFEDFFKYV